MKVVHPKKLYNKIRNSFRVFNRAISYLWSVFYIDIYFGNFWNFREYIIKNNLVNVGHKFESYYYYYYYLESKNSFIGLHTMIKGTPTLPHGLCGIFISESAVIGEGVTIFQHVTIGSNLLPDSKNNGAPKVGDNCVIGANAVLIGNINVGNNVRVGAGTTVYKDVPSDSTVVSRNLEIIQHLAKKDNSFVPNNIV